MDCLTILAQAAETANAETAAESIVPVDVIWTQVESLGLLEALTFISFGSVCLFYGWRVFKILVVICFALLGMMAGIAVSSKISGLNQIIGGVAGLGLLAALSIPLMRWAVSILGAVAGGTITAGLWYACNLSDKYMIAGALIGVVAGGMMSFIVFKVAVILFSSLGGSGLMVIGVLALLYLYPQTSEQIETLFNEQRWFMPVALIVPTLGGIIVQNKLVKTEKEWDI